MEREEREDTTVKEHGVEPWKNVQLDAMAVELWQNEPDART